MPIKVNVITSPALTVPVYLEDPETDWFEYLDY